MHGLPNCPPFIGCPRAVRAVIPKVTGFEKGVLNCDSLEQAEDTPELMFNLTNAEVCVTRDRAVVARVVHVWRPFSLRAMQTYR